MRAFGYKTVEMTRTKLSAAGPDCSRIIYGTWRLLDTKPTAQEINRRLHACVDHGITTIDTAHAQLLLDDLSTGAHDVGRYGITYRQKTVCGEVANGYRHLILPWGCPAPR